jgi:hypothetical protein
MPPPAALPAQQPGERKAPPRKEYQVHRSHLAMITIPASRSTTSPGAPPATRPSPRRQRRADRQPAIKPSAHVNSYHASACRTIRNASRIARWSVLRACYIPGLHWSWRCGAAAQHLPIARISQYETSKPLCDRLDYALRRMSLAARCGRGTCGD